MLTAGSHFHILSTPHKSEHRVKRKRLAAAFAMKNLLNWEAKVVDKVERLMTQLDRLCSTSEPPQWHKSSAVIPLENSKYTDLRTWFNLFTIEAIADIALSQRL